ncbi:MULTISPECIES: tetratricopeptide repeat protein [Parachlamydia]|uniref:tetratricopeptide repeat protein n=1 Tax=Parachlamydia TaxID=83551 RepID=UPI000750EE53|nr:tetratricopeptide repeat protein [Parachlamydia acanthamoebae]
MKLRSLVIPVLFFAFGSTSYLSAHNLTENSPKKEEFKGADYNLLKKKAHKSAKAGRTDQALQEVNLLISQQPDSPWGYKLRANIYFFDKKYQEALSDFNQVIRLRPSCANAYVDRAIVYLAMDDLESATKDIEKAIEIKPMSAFAYCVREKIYIAKAQTDIKTRGKKK